jgi:hypothetical protein
MRRWTTAALALLAACSHPRSAPALAGVGGAEMIRCATAQAADLGYGVAPGDAGMESIRAEKWIPPEGGYPASLGVISAWVAYGRDAQPRLKVRGQRLAQATSTSRAPRRGPGTGPRAFPVPGGGTGPQEEGGSASGRRIPLGRVANDAGRVESSCR